jgi:hypothetical protein
MYSINCSYYNNEFNSVDELVESVLASGMDPSYEILKNGVKTGEYLSDYLVE